MALTVESKKELINKHKRNESDTGSPEVQIAILSERIKYLTDHLKGHEKDHHTRFGLLKLVRQRQKMLNYLHREDSQRYAAIISNLNIRG